MIKHRFYILFFVLLLACTRGEEQRVEVIHQPIVTENGNRIDFHDTFSADFFTTARIDQNPAQAPFVAPGKVGAGVFPSSGASQNIILFDNPELSSTYTQLIQSGINVQQLRDVVIKQRELELERVKDLRQHGSATGQELLEAESALSAERSNLANEMAGMVEYETLLQSAGFDPQQLRNAKAGVVYVISSIPENLISKIEKGTKATVVFSAYPGEEYTGVVEGVGDIVDNLSRMVKLRIRVANDSGKLKAGMFATVSFNLEKGEFGSIDKNALVTVQGRNYVFVKTGEKSFERREVNIGQEIGDKIIILNSLNDTDEVAVKGVLQLKGLSFGY